MRAITLSLLCAACVTGCAGYKLTPISKSSAQDAHNGKADEGYIFHAPQPYLLGTLKPGATREDAKGSVAAAYDFKIVYLPDYDRPYRFTRYEVLAKSDLNLTFQNGWMLSGADSKTDTTAALSSIVELAKAVVDIIPLDDVSDAEKAAAGALPGVLLYRINLSSGTPQLEPLKLKP